MNADMTDAGFWSHWLALAQQIPVLGWAAIFSGLGGILLPLSIEHGLPDEAKKDPKLPAKSFWGAIALCIVLAVLIGWPQWRYALAIGLLMGAACHFLRYGLGKLRWLRWLRARPKVELVYDEKGNVRGAHVEGEDETIAITRPGSDKP